MCWKLEENAQGRPLNLKSWKQQETIIANNRVMQQVPQNIELGNTMQLNNKSIYIEEESVNSELESEIELIEIGDTIFDELMYN